MKILASVLTHNRKNLLKRCISALDNQTRKGFDILIIDNGSTDGTMEMLNDLKSRHHAMDVITQENLGSAGGWSRAIKFALENDFDFIWLMDDDGYPDSKALEVLTEFLQSHKNKLSCVSSIVLNENDHNKLVFNLPILDKYGYPKLFGFKRKFRSKKDLIRNQIIDTYPFAHLFNGALISLEAVRNIGNVNKDFYIYGDEVDYFFRLRKFAPIYTIIHAKHFHPDVSSRPYNIKKIYYLLKNNLILFEKHFNFPNTRKIISIALLLIRIALRDRLTMSISLILGPNSHYFYKAIYRGLSGKLAKDFEND